MRRPWPKTELKIDSPGDIRCAGNGSPAAGASATSARSHECSMALHCCIWQLRPTEAAHNACHVETTVIESCKGGPQGCPFSTFFCMLPYHLSLYDTQKEHPSTRIVCDADDTALNDRPEALYATYETKRRTSRSSCGHELNLAKVMAYTPGGDADSIPAYLPGSPHHTDEALRGPLRGLKVAGCYFGDDEWCKTMLKAQLLKRVARLADVNRLVDTERIRCSGQLKYQLVSRCASQIPNFYARCMMPSLARDAIEAVNGELRVAFELIAGGRDGTRYGLSRLSPRSFYTHHLQRISAATVRANARDVFDLITGLKQRAAAMDA